jgi:hypothetical protein
VQGLEDHVTAVRSAAANSMGVQLALAVMAPRPTASQAPKKKDIHQVEWTVATASTYLSSNFTKSKKNPYLFFFSILESYFFFFLLGKNSWNKERAESGNCSELYYLFA